MATLRLVRRFLAFASTKIFFYCLKKRRRIARKNITQCWQVLCSNATTVVQSPEWLVKKSFDSLGGTFADFLMLRWYTAQNIDSFVRLEGLECLEWARAQGRGVIITTAHFGSWELGAHALALKGSNSLIVYNNLKKFPRIDAWIKKRRELSGNTLVPKQYAFAALYRQIKKGGVVTLITDQHAVQPEGIKSTLLGQDVWSHVMFVRMSLKSGAIIVPGFMITTGRDSSVLKLCSPIDPQNYSNHENPEQAMVDAHNDVLSSMIIAHPDHWMWQHNRFKA